jgi:threonine/homoserine/homoserine lactone efflux protein
VLLALSVGFALGYLGSIPAAGPLALSIAAAALEGRARRVIWLAIGGALAEGLWALAAAHGVGWLFAANPALDRGVRFAGSALAIVAGLAIARTPPARPEPADASRAASAAATGFLFVALNPSFLATWLASCALLRAHPALATTVTGDRATALALGAAIGVVCWFATLAALIARHRDRLAAWHRQLIRTLGLVLVGIGVVWLAHTLMSWSG